jgi:hypothetical protein
MDGQKKFRTTVRFSRQHYLPNSRIGKVCVFVQQLWDPVGLELARLADLPQEVMVHARNIAEKLTYLDKAKHEASKTTKAVARRKAVLRVRLRCHQSEHECTR